MSAAAALACGHLVWHLERSDAASQVEAQPASVRGAGCWTQRTEVGDARIGEEPPGEGCVSRVLCSHLGPQVRDGGVYVQEGVVPAALGQRVWSRQGMDEWSASKGLPAPEASTSGCMLSAVCSHMRPRCYLPAPGPYPHVTCHGEVALVLAWWIL